MQKALRFSSSLYWIGTATNFISGKVLGRLLQNVAASMNRENVGFMDSLLWSLTIQWWGVGTRQDHEKRFEVDTDLRPLTWARKKSVAATVRGHASAWLSSLVSISLPRVWLPPKPVGRLMGAPLLPEDKK